MGLKSQAPNYTGIRGIQIHENKPCVTFIVENHKLKSSSMGKLVQIKTRPTESSVKEFIQAIKDEQKRNDSQAVLSIMQKLTKEKPTLWGSSIIGFGNHRYKSPATGREVEWFKIGFSPRKANLSLYLLVDQKKNAELFKKLGKHKMGVGCLYINKLEDIDVKILEKLMIVSLK